MFPFRQIAFPVDFSEQCTEAVPYVREMAMHFGADLLLIHAFEYPIWQEAGEPLESDVQKRQLRRLKDFAAEKFGGVRTEMSVVQGEPGSTISSILQSQKTDLVMLPTHGLGTFRRLLIGSVAAKLLHDLDCAVWTGVHAALAEHSVSLPFRSVMCAVNIDDDASGILKSAAAFAESYGAKLSLVHVVDTPPFSIEVDFAPIRANWIAAADLKLREMRDAAGIDAEVAVLEGSLFRRLREEVVNRQVDLLIVGRGHSQGGLTRLGSGLYNIIRESPCPVLAF